MRATRFISLFATFLVTLPVVQIAAQSNSMAHANQENDFSDAQELFSKPAARKNLGAPLDSAPLIFAPAVSYGSGGSSSDAMAMGDLNGDGKLDLVVANRSGTVSVLLGNGDGTFQPAVDYGSGGVYADSIVIADVNGDGRPDLIVTTPHTSSDDDGWVHILLGNGDGTFQSAVSYSVGTNTNSAQAVAVGDLNGDGKPDLVVAAYYDPSTSDGGVSVLLGKGDGTFQPAVVYDSGGILAQSIAIGDVNNDGKLDVVVTNYYGPGGQGGVSVLLGKGKGTFQPAVSYPTGYDAASVAIGDLNGDGKPDLVVANNQAGTVGVLLGKGDGTFQPAVDYSSGGLGPTSVAIADVNGDGKLDLAVTNAEVLPSTGVLLGNGDGTFQTPVSYDVGGEGAESVVIGDVNGDGRPDLVVANLCENVYCDSGGVSVSLNNEEAPPTTTSLVANINPVNLKQTVTYTATVAGQSGQSISGTVEFRDGYSPIATVTLAGNRAAWSTSYTAKSATGAHTVTAVYTGIYGVFEGSQSPTLTEYVRSALTKTVVTTSGSPSVLGQPVTFTTTVTSKNGGIPDGELVTFYDGAKALASVPLKAGVASYTTSTLSAKTHLIKGSYPGDNTLEPSSSHITQIVNP